MPGNALTEQKIPLIINDYSGGLNNKLHATIIPNNCSVEMQNVDHSTPGLLKTREGFTQALNTTGSFRLRGHFHFAPDNSTAYSIAATEESTQRLFKWSGTGNATNAGNITGFTSNSGANEVNFRQVNNVVYMVNGADRAVSWDGTSFVQQGTTNADFPSGTKSLAYWAGRLWTAGKATAPGYLYFSNALQPTIWDQTNMLFKIAYGTGQSAIALQPLRSGVMIVFMSHSIWQISTAGDIFGLGAFGFPPQDQFKLEQIDPEIGCGAERSVSLVGSDVYFMDQHGNIRSLQRTALDAAQGAKSLPLSDPIQGSIDTLNKTKTVLAKSSAFVFGRKYYISVPIDPATDVDTTYVLDIPLQTWTGPWTFGMSRWSFSDVEGQLYFYGSQPVAVGATYRMEDGTTDNNSTIEYSLTTKRFDFGAPFTQKIGYVLIASFVATDAASVTISAAVDGGGFTSLGNFPLDGGVGTLPQSLPFDLGGGGIARAKVHLESQDRWYDIQFQFENTTSESDTQLLNYTITANIVAIPGDA